MAPGLSRGRWFPGRGGGGGAGADKNDEKATNGRQNHGVAESDVDFDGDAAAEADQLSPADVEASKARRPNGGAKNGAESGSAVDRVREKLGLPGRSLLVVAGLLVFALLLFVIVIVLAVALSGRRTYDESQICLEPACLESSAMLRGSLNTSVKPCDNLWEFSCGSWLANNPIPASRSKWGVFEKLRFKALEQYRTIVNTLPQPLEADQLPWKIQNFYDSCMDLENINIDQARRLKDDIREYGGWAVLRNWIGNSYDPMKELKKLHANFRVEPFFSIRVVPDDVNPGFNIIKISPSGLGLPDPSYYDRSPDDQIVVAYRQFIQDAAKALGAQGPDATQFALNMFHLEKRIAEFTPAREHVDNPIATYNRVSVRQLKSIANSVPWLEILRDVFPDALISQESEVLIVSRKYVEGVSQLFFARDEATLNNFLMWKLTLKMFPFLSREYRDVYELFLSGLTGAKEKRERWEMCTELLGDVFDHALGAMYFRRADDVLETRRSLEETFDHLKSALIADLDSNGHLTHDLKSRSIEKVRQMRLQIGYPASMSDSQVLESRYQKLTVQKNDFYRNVVYSAKYKRVMDQEALVKPTREDSWLRALQTDMPSYVYQANVLVVPAHILQPPFFDGKYPRSYNYGSLGVLMARAMLRSVDDVGIHYSADGVLAMPAEGEVLVDHLRQPRRCLKEALVELHSGTNQAIERGVNCTSIDVGGVRLALRALRNSLEQHEELPQPGLTFDPEGIFFSSYSQMFCGQSRYQQEEMDSIVSRCLPARSRLQASLSQIEDFGDAFDCDGGEWSSSSRKCGRII